VELQMTVVRQKKKGKTQNYACLIQNSLDLEGGNKEYYQRAFFVMFASDLHTMCISR